MAIEDLTLIVPPPLAPVDATGRPWSDVETELGAPLPHDYKAFIETYGSGRLGEFIGIFDPFSTGKYRNLFSQIAMNLEALEELVALGAPCPYALYPATVGLLPCGLTDNGDVIHWLTSNDSNAWKIVVRESRSPMYEEFNLDLTSFLSKLLMGNVATAILRSYRPYKPKFEPSGNVR